MFECPNVWMSQWGRRSHSMFEFYMLHIQCLYVTYTMFICYIYNVYIILWICNIYNVYMLHIQCLYYTLNILSKYNIKSNVWIFIFAFEFLYVTYTMFICYIYNVYIILWMFNVLMF